MTKSTTEAAAAVQAEAEPGPRTMAFGSGEDAIVVEIPRKMKRMKFMRAMTRNDIGAALDAIWPPLPVLKDGTHQKDPLGNLMYEDHPTVVLLDDLDMTEDEFNDAMEKLGMAVAGVTPGNSEPSPSS